MTPYLLTDFQVEYTEHSLTVYLPAHEREIDIEVVALMPLRAPGDQLVAAKPGAEPVFASLRAPGNESYLSFTVDCHPEYAQFYLMVMISDEVIVSTTGRSVEGRPNEGDVRDAWLEIVRTGQAEKIYGQFRHLHWESAVIAVPVR